MDFKVRVQGNHSPAEGLGRVAPNVFFVYNRDVVREISETVGGLKSRKNNGG